MIKALANFTANTVFFVGHKTTLLSVWLHKKFKTPVGQELLRIEEYQKSMVNKLKSYLDKAEEVQAAKKIKNIFYLNKETDNGNN